MRVTSKRSLWLATLLMAAVQACSHGVSNYDYTKEPDPRRQEFVLGPSDQLRITVWKNTELSTEAQIRPDGTITMPLIGDIRAVGKTPTSLRDEITQRLQAYIREGSNVTVAVVAVNSYRFTVSGAVEHPGVYSASNYVTVAEAIALAGGVNRFGSPDSVQIIRTDKNTSTTRKIPINYALISAGQHLEQNIVILPGDNVYIP